MAVHHFPQSGGFDDFDLIAPHIEMPLEMPRHLKNPACVEAHGHGAIFAIGNLLAGMEY